MSRTLLALHIERGSTVNSQTKTYGRSNTAANHAPHKASQIVFILSLIGLAVLPMTPEIGMILQSHGATARVGLILYFECIAGFLLFMPALLLPRAAARFWAIAAVVFSGPPTLILGFYCAAYGAPWNMTAHSALFQTNSLEAWGFLKAFLSWRSVIPIGIVVAVYAICLNANLRSQRPRRRWAVCIVAAGFLASAHGLNLASGYSNFRPQIEAKGSSKGSAPVRMLSLSPKAMYAPLPFYTVHYNYLSTHHYYLEQYRQAETRYPRLEGAVTIPGAISPRAIIVAIGESANRRHWSLYGYSRDTTPKMRQLSPELSVFSDVISTSVGTLPSIRGMLTTGDDSTPVFHLFSAAGYRTHWISAQNDLGADAELGAQVATCEDRAYRSGAFDEALVPLLSDALNEPGRQMIFVHLIGSHVPYGDRYPGGQAVFHGVGSSEELRATYDNSIHYTDHVLSRMISLLRERGESSCLLYVSDHGEDVFDSRPDKYLFRSESVATNVMYEVPFIIWLSSQYKGDNADFVASSVAGATRRKFQNRALYHSLISLARLKHPLYRAEDDLLSPAFVERERRVGAAGACVRQERLV